LKSKNLENVGKINKYKINQLQNKENFLYFSLVDALAVSTLLDYPRVVKHFLSIVDTLFLFEGATF